MISKEEIKHIAELARLRISEIELEEFENEFSSILDYFNSLQEVDTSNVLPTFHPTEALTKKKIEEMREDEPEDANLSDHIKSSFSEKKEGYLKVKPVLK